MKFDKSKVYTAANADELRAGDKVIVADDMLTLKAKVSEGFNWYVVAITSILGEEWYGRFDIDKHNFPLAYLVERAENCTNCGGGRWDAEHKKIFCDPAHCGSGNVVFRNQEVEVCEYWKPKTKQKAEQKNCYNCRLTYTRNGVMRCMMNDQRCNNPEVACYHYEPKTEPKAEKDCDNCGQRCDGYGKGEVCSQWKSKAEKHTDYNHCEEARKVCAMTNACPEKHYRPFKDIDELIKVWKEKSKQVHSDYSLTMPYIWVQDKDNDVGKAQHLITDFNVTMLNEDNDGYDVGITVNCVDMTLEDLFEHFEFLDGSPCGVEE